MFKHFEFDDQITIYFDYNDSSRKNLKLYINNVLYKTFSSSNVSIYNLDHSTNYDIKIIDNGNIIFSEMIKTKTKKTIIDVTKEPYLANADGSVLSTESIQKAINDGENSLIYFKKGTYLTGALNIPSNREIYLEEGATILGSKDPHDYLPLVDSRFEGIELKCLKSLINIGQIDHDSDTNTSNIIIRGNGAIIGGGITLHDNSLKYEESISSSELNGRTRGRLISIFNSKDIIIDGLYLSKSPSWNVQYVYSDNIIISNSHFESFGIHNGDGIDPDSSINSYIFNCYFDVGDDCVAIKSGKNPEGNFINRPSENISIFDCQVEKGHGMSIGSEVSGGINNIKIWNCDFERTLYGLHIKSTKKRGGYIKNIDVRDSIIARVIIDEVKYNDDGESSNNITEIENISISDSVISGIIYLDEHRNEKTQAFYIDCPGLKLKNINLNNISIKDSTLTDSKYLETVKEVKFKNIKY